MDKERKFGPTRDAALQHLGLIRDLMNRSIKAQEKLTDPGAKVRVESLRGGVALLDTAAKDRALTPDQIMGVYGGLGVLFSRAQPPEKTNEKPNGKKKGRG